MHRGMHRGCASGGTHRGYASGARIGGAHEVMTLSVQLSKGSFGARRMRRFVHCANKLANGGNPEEVHPLAPAPPSEGKRRRGGRREGSLAWRVPRFFHGCGDARRRAIISYNAIYYKLLYSNIMSYNIMARGSQPGRPPPPPVRYRFSFVASLVLSLYTSLLYVLFMYICRLGYL